MKTLLLFVVLGSLGAAGCRSAGYKKYLSSAETLRLRHRMSKVQVQNRFGRPPMREYVFGERTVWKYRVYSPLGGKTMLWIVFLPKSGLDTWFERREEYEKALVDWGVDPLAALR